MEDCIKKLIDDGIDYESGIWMSIYDHLMIDLNQVVSIRKVESEEDCSLEYISIGMKSGAEIKTSALDEDSVQEEYEHLWESWVKLKNYKKGEIKMAPVLAKKSMVDQNKNAAIEAAKLQTGKIILTNLKKLASKNIPMAGMFIDKPWGTVLIANALSMAISHFKAGDEKWAKVSDAALTAAYIDGMAELKLDKILGDLLKGVSLDALTNAEEVTTEEVTTEEGVTVV
jgi:hypothetical protein